jgi:hypothetical protein
VPRRLALDLVPAVAALDLVAHALSSIWGAINKEREAVSQKKTSRVRGMDEPEVAALIRQILQDMLNHIFGVFLVESGCLYPSAILNQTLDSH